MKHPGQIHAPQQARAMSDLFTDKEGTLLTKGDWVHDFNQAGRSLEVIGPTPGGFLELKANDGKPFPQWLYAPIKLRNVLRNPILSQS